MGSAKLGHSWLWLSGLFASHTPENSPLSKPVATGLQLTPLDPEFREDPYPILKELREREPTHRDTELDRWFFTRHQDVNEILRNQDLFSDPRKARPGSFARVFLSQDEREPSMLMMDDPGHRRLRELVRHPFKPNAVEAWRPRVRAVAEHVISQIDEPEFDVIAHVANPIPTVVIAELLGLDASCHDQFKQWSEDMISVAFSPVNSEEQLQTAEKAGQALDAFFRNEIQNRRDQPRADLISEMLQADASGDHLTEDEIVSQCNLLLLAGNLTTSDLIGNGIMALLQHPTELAKLRANPELMSNAVEEVLRYESPVVNSGRIAHTDMEIGGQKVLAGDSLSVSLAAANRDPAVHSDPDRFDIERKTIHLQSFGGGRHFCLGAHLSRLEAAETFSVLFERFPDLAISGKGHRYAANPGFRGFAELWVSAR